ncbi:MAG: 5-formyltetrahydrofolate cyclo-ligase [Muribaculaceae bacterium]|nr:5-formyltetrahydrofolate cyclo-ligase [Muribaculaceae bacterium]
MKKEDIRRLVRASKSMLTERERIQAAEDVFEQLEQLAAFMMSEHILMYHSLPDELSTHRFLDKWHNTKRFYLPRVNGVNLDILPYEESTLKLGSFHIEEPQGNSTADIDDIELVVVPAMAYDRKGNRVGHGKGYYDRLLAGSKAIKIGVAYDCQLVEEIDTDPFDQPVDIVITQSRTYRRRPR